MGMTAALKARTVVETARNGLAIELLVAAQALDLRLPLQPGVGVRAAYRVHPAAFRHMSGGPRAAPRHHGRAEMLPEIDQAARAPPACLIGEALAVTAIERRG